MYWKSFKNLSKGNLKQKTHRMEQLLVLLQNSLSPDDGTRSQAENTLNQMKQQDVRQLITSLIQVFSTPNIDLTCQASAIIYLWRLFPENIQEVPLDQPHPFDVYSEEVVQNILNSSFQLMTQGIPQLRNYGGVLFGRVASLQVHRNLESNIVLQLSQVLGAAQTIEELGPISVALQKVCNEFEPEGDELTALLTTIFTILGSPKSPEIANEVLKILSVIVTAMSTVVENEETLGNIIRTLLTLATADGVQAAALGVWTEISKVSSEIIAYVAPQLIEISLGILADEKKDENDFLAASKIVKLIAKLEFQNCTDGELGDEFAPIRTHFQPLVISLVRVCCTSSIPDCDDGSSWESYMAASQSLKHVLRLASDEEIASVFPIMSNLAGSQLFNERFGGLILLSRAIMCSENPKITLPFIQSLFNLVNETNEQAPRVRYQAIKCLKNFIMCLCDNQDFIEELPAMSQSCYSMMPLLDLNSPIALQVAALLGEITRIPNFPHTTQILQTLLQKGTNGHISKYFDIICKIVDCGSDEQSTFQFYPIILQTVQVAVSNPSSIWALHDLGEIIQAYLAKFQDKLAEMAGNTIQLLLQGAHTPSIFASDTLIPLGMHAKIFPQIFTPFAQPVLQVINAAMNEVRNSEIIYDAAMALTFIIMGHIQFPEMVPTFLGQLYQAISNLDISLEARRACVGCISDFAEHEPAIFLPMVNNFITFLRTFSIIEALNVEYMTDPKETQLMLHALASCTLNIMKAVGPANSTAYFDIAKNIITFSANMIEKEEILERLLIAIIALLFFVVSVDANFVLEIIEESPEVGELILTARSNGIEMAQNLLTALKYEE
ncbi:hypothetical protein TRFO_05332 [Tritrichomonas foetus]|uniref:Importin N-terminal domain-containing protein n=1 Tax=Tritrichomonas foetus TaxID=1144522 RepID=A0A1J4K6V8_9EUKA|nr:hypothetical protein TRFO_05332 [Tritrichomonas foetus]|eukprot:OHT07103.1 hypothetical protein TRFO_05332 [Tritrichomonas foetus]